MKQTELAELTGIDPKHMSKIECGRCFPSFELLDKIAEKLNTPAAFFLETDHLQPRDILMEKIVTKLRTATDEKFRSAYKILKEIL